MEDIANETLVETEVSNEDKYPLEDFIANSEALGYKKYVVAGALFNCKEKEISKNKFKKLVEDFLGRKVE